MSTVSKIRDALREKGLDALLVKEEKNRRYVTGFHSTAGMALITQDTAFFITDSRYIEAARAVITDFSVAESTTHKTEKDWLRALTAEYGVKALGFEEDFLSVSAFRALQEAAEKAYEYVPAQELLWTLRASKSEQEIAAMTAAQRIAEKALEAVLPLIRPGVKERDLAAELSYRMSRLGGEGNSFDPIVVAGPRSSMPHGVPGDNAIASGDFVTMDFGCVVEGYCSDMTRTVAVGEATEEMRRVYGIVLEAQLCGIAAARPGLVGAEVDAAARKVIADAGYGAYFGHGFGHSLGLDIHEAPNAAPTEKKVLPEGTVISAEPGIYLPGKFGVRIEDVMVLRNGGAEVITKMPKELLVL